MSTAYARISQALSKDFDFEEVECDEMADELFAKFQHVGLSRELAQKIAPYLMACVECEDDKQITGMAARMHSMLREIRDASKPRYTAAVILMATGLDDSKESSMRRLADAYGVSAEIVSRNVDTAQTKYGLRKNHFNKKNPEVYQNNRSNKRA
jgi:hypothetical protein